MHNIGILCPVMTGHINSLVPLAQELQRRGNKVTFFQFPDARLKVEQAGLNFHAIAQEQCPIGTISARCIELAQLHGIKAAVRSIDLFAWFSRLHLQYLPEALRSLNIEGLIVDQTIMEGMSIAQHLDLPFVSFTSALPLNREDTIPPYFSGWTYGTALWLRWRNKLTYQAFHIAINKNKKLLNSHRQQWGLPPMRNYAESFSPVAQICQEPREFEFPRQKLPPHFHFTGPYHYQGRSQPVDFPFERLDDRPLVYASLGTIMNLHSWIFEAIAEACADLPVQLVISLGQPDLQSLPSFAGNPIVVPFAPQLEVLKRASLVVTHAGMNTTLEALTQGVPLVAIPIANDEPAIAARIVWNGVGAKIEPSKLTPQRLRSVIQKVLTQDSYRRNATRIQEAIQKSGGVERAADIVERGLLTRQPVIA